MIDTRRQLAEALELESLRPVPPPPATDRERLRLERLLRLIADAVGYPCQ
jgi:hypothetical protein